jgi:7-carboxy-7-deazaguanine synthase
VSAARKYPVIEVFGPTVQGEGPHAGRVVDFVRFGGCDFRCSWCDSLYAVEPAQVRANAEQLTADEIVERLPGTGPVILSGGNPALIHGDQLAAALAAAGRPFHIETQGTVWRPWMVAAEMIVVSPKPPSSGMADKAAAALPRFLRTRERSLSVLDGGGTAGGSDLTLKFVVADATDLLWALDQREAVDPLMRVPLFLSALTPPGCSLDQLAASYRNLCQLVLELPRAQAHQPVVLPQLHVVAWGHERGV